MSDPTRPSSESTPTTRLQFTESYQPIHAFEELGEGFADQVEPAHFPQHVLRFRNQAWAERLGLGLLTNEQWIEHFAKFKPLSRNLSQPLALRYHGHQFRVYNPNLGDGRGFLFAQLIDPINGHLLDLGTKGSGQTPWSRSGDGRLTLKGAVREVLATEMLEMLGVPTSKTWSVVETGERLQRQDEPSPTRSAVLVRLSHGHIRFGSFQRLAALRDSRRLKLLLHYSIKHYFSFLNDEPHLQMLHSLLIAETGQEPSCSVDFTELIQTFLKEVTRRAARTCASWMMAGFVHGVLNTDNMNITGETFDFGPYRFLPVYDPLFTAAYFDQSGLYCYGRQPESVLWNLEQLAGCFLNLLPNDQEAKVLTDAVSLFIPEFQTALATEFMRKLGLRYSEPGSSRETEYAEKDIEEVHDLIQVVFQFLGHSQVGFEQFFFDWFGGRISRVRAQTGIASSFYIGDVFKKFDEKIEEFAPSVVALQAVQNSDSSSPSSLYYRRPRPCTLLIDEIEWIWEAIEQKDDWSRFEKKIEDIRKIRFFVSLKK